MSSVDPVDLTIVSSGNGWVGTFGLTVKFLADDILSDGASFPARITWDEGDVGGTAEFIVVGTTPEGLLVENRDEPIEWESILKVEI